MKDKELWAMNIFALTLILVLLFASESCSPKPPSAKPKEVVPMYYKTDTVEGMKV
jgi:hypothetical protein